MPNYMLTTYDNPFDPFTEYEDWENFDSAKGYNTPGVLSAHAITSNSWSDADNSEAINVAVDEIVSHPTNYLFIRAIEGKPNGLKNMNKNK